MERIPLRQNNTGRTLLLTSFALLALGVVMVHSAVASVLTPGAWYARVDVRHTIFAAMAAGILCSLWAANYHWLAKGRRFPVLAGGLLVLAVICTALVFVPGVGHGMGGKLRWIRLGPREYSIGFQPAELLKIAMLVFLAAWLSRKTVNPRSFWKTFLPAVALVGLCVALVIRDDFGSAAILVITAVVTLLLARVPWYYLLTLLPPAAAGFYKFVYLDPDRWGRIQAMVDPWSQANRSAFQPRQSLLAILNGGWFGRGPGNGTLKLGFLPEDSTDFIFAVYCEEWGFIGAVLLMGLLLLWIFHARRAAVRAGDEFGRLLAGALGFLIAFQAVMHIAVDMVAAPPTGMSMPFVSAGGTALLATAAATAIIVSVSARSKA